MKSVPARYLTSMVSGVPEELLEDGGQDNFYDKFEANLSGESRDLQSRALAQQDKTMSNQHNQANTDENGSTPPLGSPPPDPIHCNSDGQPYQDRSVRKAELQRILRFTIRELIVIEEEEQRLAEAEENRKTEEERAEQAPVKVPDPVSAPVGLPGKVKQPSPVTVAPAAPPAQVPEQVHHPEQVLHSNVDHLPESPAEIPSEMDKKQCNPTVEKVSAIEEQQRLAEFKMKRLKVVESCENFYEKLGAIRNLMDTYDRARATDQPVKVETSPQVNVLAPSTQVTVPIEAAAPVQIRAAPVKDQAQSPIHLCPPEKPTHQPSPVTVAPAATPVKVPEQASHPEQVHSVMVVPTHRVADCESSRESPVKISSGMNTFKDSHSDDRPVQVPPPVNVQAPVKTQKQPKKQPVPVQAAPQPVQVPVKVTPAQDEQPEKVASLQLQIPINAQGFEISIPFPTKQQVPEKVPEQVLHIPTHRVADRLSQTNKVKKPYYPMKVPKVHRNPPTRSEVQRLQLPTVEDMLNIAEKACVPLVLTFPPRVSLPARDIDPARDGTFCLPNGDYELSRSSMSQEVYVGQFCSDFRHLRGFDTAQAIYRPDRSTQHMRNIQSGQFVREEPLHEDTVLMRLFNDRLQKEDGKIEVQVHVQKIRTEITSLRGGMTDPEKVQRFRRIVGYIQELHEISPKFNVDDHQRTLSVSSKFGDLSVKEMKRLHASEFVHSGHNDEVRDEKNYDLRQLLAHEGFQYPDNEQFDSQKEDIVDLMNTAKNWALAPTSARIRSDESLASIERADAKCKNRAEQPTGCMKMKNCPNCLGRLNHEVFLDIDEKVRKQHSMCQFVCRACGVSHGIGGFACYRLNTVCHQIEAITSQLRGVMNDRNADGSLRNRLIYLTAPAGSGKTTRLMEYLARNMKQRNVLVLTPHPEAARRAYEFVSPRLNYQLGAINNLVTAYRELERSWAILADMSRSNDAQVFKQNPVELLSQHLFRLERYNEAHTRLVDVAYTCSFISGPDHFSRSPNSFPNIARNKLVYCSDAFAVDNIRILALFDIVVLDDSHETTRNRELITAAIRQLMDANPKGGPQVIVMSASMLVPDPEKVENTALGRLLRHFDVRPMVVQFEPSPHHPQFHTTVFFAGPGDPMCINRSKGFGASSIPVDLFGHVQHALYFSEYLRRQRFGAAGRTGTVSGTLIFVPRKEDCEYIARNIRKEHPRVLAVPFHADYDCEAYESYIFNPREGEEHRVIVATHIADSLNIPCLGCVIDTGLALRKSFLEDLNCVRFQVCDVTQSERIQRWGRVGRQFDGFVINMMTQERAMEAEAEVMPEIERSDYRVTAIAYNRLANELIRFRGMEGRF